MCGGSNTTAARTLTHARILLKADEGVAGPRLSDEAIAEALEVNRSTVERVGIRCVEEGFELALRPRPSRQVHPRKLDGAQQAHLDRGRHFARDGAADTEKTN